MLLGGSATIEDLTGVDKKIAAFLVPIFSCWIYTVYGGLRATFFASCAGRISNILGLRSSVIIQTEWM